MNEVGDSIKSNRSGWKFSGEVPEKFDAHVIRSIPFYAEGHDLICKVSDYFLSENSIIYDLGTSTGELLKKLSTRHRVKNQKFIGIDREPEMLLKAKDKIKNDKRISFQQSEMTELEILPSDFIVCYYSMQFVRPAFRQEVYNKIFESLQWGGAFVLFEKTRSPDARFQDITTGLYTDFKLENSGYSSNEIISKTRSLRGVLEPFSSQGNYDMLSRAGFKDFMPIFKYICFEGILAIK